MVAKKSFAKIEIVEMPRILLMLTALAANAPSASVIHVEKSIVLQHDFSGQPTPRFRNGFTISYNADTLEVSRWDRTGELVRQSKLAIPEAGVVKIHDVAVARDGLVAVAASVTQAGKAAAVIAWIEPAGETTRIVKTSPFAAHRLTFSDDGMLWAAGRVHDAVYEDEAAYDVFRQYDRAGVLKRTAVPTNSFSPGTGSPSFQGFLVGARDRLTMISVTRKEFIELGFHGEVLGRWKVSSFPGDYLTGAAVVGSTLFVSIQNRPAPEARTADTSIYAFDKSTGSFALVNTTALQGSERSVHLMGQDGHQLVVRTRPGNELHWLRVE